MNKEIKDNLSKNGYKGEFGLSELIESCGSDFTRLFLLGTTMGGKKDWGAGNGTMFFRGSTPEEAVANLWMFLNKR